MTNSADTPTPSGLGTCRMAFVLGLALVVNLALLLLPLFVGSGGDNAVAAHPPAHRAVAPPPATAPAVTAPDRSTSAGTHPSSIVPQESVAESPDVVTIVGDEPLTPAVVIAPALRDRTTQVESPAPVEILENADPVTPASETPAGNGSDDPTTAIVLEVPVNVGPVPPRAPMPDFDPCLLELVNPPETNGPVHFVIDGAVHTLQPGESRQWLALSDREVAFHRGDDFGDTSCQVQRGTWRFRVTEAGWELIADEHVSMFVQP